MSRSDHTKLPELFMQLRDRDKLVRLMDIQGVSQRELAIAAGMRSHTYIGWLIKGHRPDRPGNVDGVNPKAAARIARHLGVGIDDLFVTRLSTDSAQSARRKRAA